MSRALSMDLRRQVMVRLAEGETIRQVAVALSVAPSSVVKWPQRLSSCGLTLPAAGSCGNAIRGGSAVPASLQPGPQAGFCLTQHLRPPQLVRRAFFFDGSGNFAPTSLSPPQGSSSGR